MPLLSLALLLAPARADQAIGDTKLHTGGEVRLIGALPPDFTVDTDGNTVDQGFVLDQRLRAGLAWRAQGWHLELEGDLLTGQVAGDTWALPAGDARRRDQISVTGAESFVLRRANVGAKLGPVRLVAGANMSHWGLGLVANDGAHAPFFGRSDFGDRVLRVQATTAPLKRKGDMLPLYFTLAADRGIADEIGAMADGQEVWQGIASVLYRQKGGSSGGIYYVYRDQWEPDDVRRTQASILDAYAEVVVPTDGRFVLRVGAEAAGILGSTSRATSYNSREGLAVSSAGAAGIITAGLPEERALLHLRSGWASGDGNPDDDVLHSFSFDRDFDVGMVMFDELLGSISAAAWGQLSDPANAGQAPDGADTLLNEGAFHDATFLQPIVEANPAEWVNLKLGGLVAWQTAPIAQPFATYRAGGQPTNHLGVPTTGYRIGTEVDWAVRLQRPVQAGLAWEPALLLQGGHLLPSADLAGEEGVLSLLMVQGQVRW